MYETDDEFAITQNYLCPDLELDINLETRSDCEQYEEDKIENPTILSMLQNRLFDVVN